MQSEVFDGISCHRRPKDDVKQSLARSPNRFRRLIERCAPTTFTKDSTRSRGNIGLVGAELKTTQFVGMAGHVVGVEIDRTKAGEDPD